MFLLKSWMNPSNCMIYLSAQVKRFWNVVKWHSPFLIFENPAMSILINELEKLCFFFLFSLSGNWFPVLPLILLEFVCFVLRDVLTSETHTDKQTGPHEHARLLPHGSLQWSWTNSLPMFPMARWPGCKHSRRSWRPRPRSSPCLLVVVSPACS